MQVFGLFADDADERLCEGCTLFFIQTAGHVFICENNEENIIRLLLDSDIFQLFTGSTDREDKERKRRRSSVNAFCVKILCSMRLSIHYKFFPYFTLQYIYKNNLKPL